MIIGIPGNLGDGKSITMAMLARHYQSICSECMGIINRGNIIFSISAIEGIHMHDCTCEHPKPNKIHANFWLNLPDVHYVTTMEDIDKIYDGYAFFDEFWSWIDSRVSGYSDVNLVVTGILLNSRKRGFNIIYETKLAHMTDRRIRENANYYLKPNKYIDIDGELTQINQNILYQIDMKPYIENTWFIVGLCDSDGFMLEEDCFQFPLTAGMGLYDTKEEIQTLSKGESSPGLEKGIKVERHFAKAIQEILPDSEIVQSRQSRGWDIKITTGNNNMAFDVVSVQKSRKTDKTPYIDVRRKHINTLIKNAYKSNTKPFWAFFWEGKWYIMDMLESHALKSSVSCRDAKEMKEVLSYERR